MECMKKKGTQNQYIDDDLMNTFSNPDYAQSLMTNNSNDDHKNSNNDDLILQTIMDLESIDINMSRTNDPLKLNVGGTLYETTLFTVSKFPNCTLYQTIKNQKSKCKDGSYFIDRDGYLFRFILNYLRDSQLVIPNTNNNHIIDQLILEAKYYQISPLLDDLLLHKIQSEIFEKSNKKKLFVSMIIDWIDQEMHNINKHCRKDSWNLLFKYDASMTSPFAKAQPHHIIRQKCNGLRSVLMIYCAGNQLFGVYCYDRFDQKAYRQKNFLFWIGQYLSDGVHKNSFANFENKKWKCLFCQNGDIIAAPENDKVEQKIEFIIGSNDENCLCLKYLKGEPIKTLADKKSELVISMCEIFHIKLTQ